MIQLMQGDCLERMKEIADCSVDMVMSDPPYGTTACKWDTCIPFEPMWEQLKRIIKPNGAIVLFGSQPFTSALVMSNPKMFKYSVVWQKSQSTGHLNAWRMPMRAHEDISVFYNKQPTYNPELKDKHIANVRPVTKTYTNDGETVLDFCAGSGTTGVACCNTNRKFIGIELDPEYFKIAQERISKAGITKPVIARATYFLNPSIP